MYAGLSVGEFAILYLLCISSVCFRAGRLLAGLRPLLTIKFDHWIISKFSVLIACLTDLGLFEPTATAPVDAALATSCGHGELSIAAPYSLRRNRPRVAVSPWGVTPARAFTTRRQVIPNRSSQLARNHRITAWVLAELSRLQARGHSDQIFSVSRVWADPRFMDPTFDPPDRVARTCYGGPLHQADRGALGMARAMTLASRTPSP